MKMTGRSLSVLLMVKFANLEIIKNNLVFRKNLKLQYGFCISGPRYSGDLAGRDIRAKIRFQTFLYAEFLKV
jgi:hypothetical protein